MQTTHTIHPRSAADLHPIPDQSAHLIVTSPPYPMIEMWDQTFAQQTPAARHALDTIDGPAAFEAMHQLLDPVWKHCQRILIPGGFLCVNIGDATRKIGDNFRLYTNHTRITTACEALGFQSLPPIIWCKQTNAPNKFMGSGMLPAGAYATLEHEYILILRNGDKRKFNAGQKNTRRQSAIFWEERNQWFSDLWDFKGTRQEMGNPKTRKRSGAFPFQLAWRLIHMYSLQGETIIDPFLGTGTTTAAAIASARNSIGCEIDTHIAKSVTKQTADYIQIGREQAAQRLQNHQEFIARRQHEKKPIKYTNTPHGFPVITRQEQELTILQPTAINKEDDLQYTAEHATIPIQESLL